MSKCILFACGILTAMAVQAAEEAPVPTDRLGIYFDTAGTQYCKDGVLGEVEAYLILSNPSDTTGVAGWECRVEVATPEGNLFTGFELSGQNINASTEPDFAVGLSPCLANDKTVILATLRMIVLTSDRWDFYVRPTDASSVLGAASYAPCNDPGELVKLNPANGRWDKPTAWLNAACAGEPAQKNPWERLKDQYR
jgi:hypothetical protein